MTYKHNWRLVVGIGVCVAILAFISMRYWDDLPNPKKGVLYYYQKLSQEKKEFKKEEIHLVPSWQGRDVFVIIHGYTESSSHQWIQNMTQALLETIPSAVVLLVDHWNLLHFSRPIMAVNIDLISEDIAGVLVSLEDAARVRLSEVHILGFSIGGRIAGVIPTFLPTGRKIGRITGLDPSFPWQQTTDRKNYLDDSDAEVVVIMRTSRIGMQVPPVSLDFTINGGSVQPGCQYNLFLNMFQDICSHHRIQKFFTEAVRRGPQSFVGCRCQSLESYNNGSCNCTERNTFALHTNTSLKGKFFLKTHPVSPFSHTYLT